MMNLEQRTKHFALAIIHLFESLSQTPSASIIGKQLLRSGTSVGAQYREAKRARSRAEFISKIDSSIQELDETLYWLELLSETKLGSEQLLAILHREASELIAMLVASSKTAKQNS